MIRALLVSPEALCILGILLPMYNGLRCLRLEARLHALDCAHRKLRHQLTIIRVELYKNESFLTISLP